MLNAENVKTMKQTNISADGDQTKQRVKEILKGASKEQKVEMTELSGLKLTSLQRVYATGNISAKIAVAIAQVMNVDPNYLTGEAGEPGEYSAEIINAFLSAKGYDSLVQKEQKPRRKYNRKPNQAIAHFRKQHKQMVSKTTMRHKNHNIPAFEKTKQQANFQPIAPIVPYLFLICCCE